MTHVIGSNIQLLTEVTKNMYSVRQKQCSKFSNEKSLVFFTVNLVENLHVSTYDIYEYTYKIEKIAAEKIAA